MKKIKQLVIMVVLTTAAGCATWPEGAGTAGWPGSAF